MSYGRNIGTHIKKYEHIGKYKNIQGFHMYFISFAQECYTAIFKPSFHCAFSDWFLEFPYGIRVLNIAVTVTKLFPFLICGNESYKPPRASKTLHDTERTSTTTYGVRAIFYRICFFRQTTSEVLRNEQNLYVRYSFQWILMRYHNTIIDWYPLLATFRRLRSMIRNV